MKITISSNGRIVLPAEFRKMDGVESGQEFDVERFDRGEYRLVRRAAPRNEGAIGWLLACPAKGFFVPVESTSSARRQSRLLNRVIRSPERARGHAVDGD